ncbi:Thyroid hormone receptor-associated protein 3 [Sciurus carolinensis]|uniref:Thyroid hormone receptor-associated protein 3 n=1 Tax=Sciurus carolinensis TaxID=30640 RepID=A0AA41NET8_SCICA|nr:Thyroid hormone receptor-associated protein 3 [Sciurus carolinensis]
MAEFHKEETDDQDKNKTKGRRESEFDDEPKFTSKVTAGVSKSQEEEKSGTEILNEVNQENQWIPWTQAIPGKGRRRKERKLIKDQRSKRSTGEHQTGAGLPSLLPVISLLGEDEFPVEAEDREESTTDSKSRLGTKDFVGSSERGGGRARGTFQFPARGRGWGEGSYAGNDNNSSDDDFQKRNPEQEWDPEYTPKSEKQHLKT